MVEVKNKDELVKLVSERVGITEQQAATAVDLVLKFVMDQLPEPLAKQVDALLKGEGTPPDLKRGLGAIFGEKKE